MTKFKIVEAEFKIDQGLLVQLPWVEQINELATDLSIKAIIC